MANPKARVKKKQVAMGGGEDGDLEHEYMLIVVGHGYSPDKVEQIPLNQGKVLSYTSVNQKLYSSQAKQVLDRLSDGKVLRRVDGDPENKIPDLELYTQVRDVANYTVAFEDPHLEEALECKLGYYIFNPHHEGDNKVMPLNDFCADCKPRREYATIRDLRCLLERLTQHTKAPISHILYLACKDIVDKVPVAIKAKINETVNMEVKLLGHSSQPLPTQENDSQKMMEKNVSALKKEALGLGATDGEVNQCLARKDVKDRKAAFVELIYSKQPAPSTACRDATLLSMDVSELELQARSVGASEQEIDEAYDAEDVHASLVDLLFTKQMAREAALRGQTRYIFVGNPAAGKSTLLNAFLGGDKTLFKSSDRVGGFTSVMKEYYCPERNATFVDTPGLDDINIFERARNEISMAFQAKGKSKLVFVFNHQSSRCQQDIITLHRILEAFEKAEVLHYGIIINKYLPPDGSNQFMLDLKKQLEDEGGGRHIVSLASFEFQEKIARTPDVKPTVPEDLRIFLEKLPPIDLDNVSVGTVGGGSLKEEDSQQSELKAKQQKLKTDVEEKRKQEIEASAGSGMRAAKTLKGEAFEREKLTKLFEGTDLLKFLDDIIKQGWTSDSSITQENLDKIRVPRIHHKQFFEAFEREKLTKILEGIGLLKFLDDIIKQGWWTSDGMAFITQEKLDGIALPRNDHEKFFEAFERDRLTKLLEGMGLSEFLDGFIKQACTTDKLGAITREKLDEIGVPRIEQNKFFEAAAVKAAREKVAARVQNQLAMGNLLAMRPEELSEFTAEVALEKKHALEEAKDLREKREELNRQILKEEEDKAKIQKEMSLLTDRLQEEEEDKTKIQKELSILVDRLQKVNESLVRKSQARNEYDKTIQETEAPAKNLQEAMGDMFGKKRQRK